MNSASASITFQPDVPIRVSRVTIPNLEISKTVYVHNYKGPDIGYKIEQANRECAADICEIKVDQTGTISTRVSLSNNRILHLSAGTYLMKAQIVLGSNNEIVGQGSNVTTLVRDSSFFEGAKSDFRTNPPSSFNKVSNAPIIKSEGLKNIYIHDLGIDGSTSKIGWYPLSNTNIPDMNFQMPKGKQSEIKISNSDNVLISKVSEREVQTHGIALTAVNGITIENCEIGSNGWNAFQLLWLGGAQNNNVLINNNFIHGSSHAAIHVDVSSMVEMSNNTLDGNRLNTFQTGSGGSIGISENSHDISILNNKITNSEFTKGDSSNGFKPMAGHGIAEHGNSVWIMNNYIENNEGAGINVNSVRVNHILKVVQDVSVSGNTIKYNGLHAFGYDLSINYDPSVKNIVIGNNTLTGAINIRSQP